MGTDCSTENQDCNTVSQVCECKDEYSRYSSTNKQPDFLSLTDGACIKNTFPSGPNGLGKIWFREEADSQDRFRIRNQLTRDLLTEDILAPNAKVEGSHVPPMYTSDTNQLILWMKTNSDTMTGQGFHLDWMEVDP